MEGGGEEAAEFHRLKESLRMLKFTGDVQERYTSHCLSVCVCVCLCVCLCLCVCVYLTCCLLYHFFSMFTVLSAILHIGNIKFEKVINEWGGRGRGCGLITLFVDQRR